MLGLDYSASDPSTLVRGEAERMAFDPDAGFTLTLGLRSNVVWMTSVAEEYGFVGRPYDVQAQRGILQQTSRIPEILPRKDYVDYRDLEFVGFFAYYTWQAVGLNPDEPRSMRSLCLTFNDLHIGYDNLPPDHQLCVPALGITSIKSWACSQPEN